MCRLFCKRHKFKKRPRKGTLTNCWLICWCMKKDIHVWKETCIYENRPIYMKRDLEKRPRKKRPRKKSQKRDLDELLIDALIYEKRHTYLKRDICMWKETQNRTGTLMNSWLMRWCMKRDIHVWKETCIYENKPIYMKRDLEKRPRKKRPRKKRWCVKRDIHVWKETCIYENRPIYMKRDLEKGPRKKSALMYEKRHTCVKRDMYIWKETQKRDPNKRPRWILHGYWCMKRDIHMWKET